MLFTFPSNLNNYLFNFSFSIKVTPIIIGFIDTTRSGRMKGMIQENYNHIKVE